MIVVPTLGCVYLVELMLRRALAEESPFHLHLYQNNYTPQITSTVANFSPATFSGYAIAEMPRDVWQPAFPLGFYGYIQFGTEAVSWLALSGSQLLYGYYVTDDTDTQLLWAERFPAPVTVTTTTPVFVTPVMRMRTEF